MSKTKLERVKTSFALGILIVTVSCAHFPLLAQQQCVRIMVQDSTQNNLVDPSGYQTAKLGLLGDIVKVGSGPQSMILIPGLGFGGNIFDDFMERHSDEYTMYAVTLPGFGGTAAPPTPSPEVSFGEMTWTNAAYEAIEKLIRDEKLNQPIVLGHWLTGPQLALRLALDHPNDIKAVIVVAGSACFVMTDTTKYPPHPELDKRIQGIDSYIAPFWFKTVTRETWDDNNFLPGDYSVNPIMGLRLWRQAAQPLLHVWIRYLCEFYSQDITLELKSLKVPTLLIKPGLDGIFFDSGGNYMEAFCHVGWNTTIPGNRMITSLTIPNSRVCVWCDHPQQFDQAISDFVETIR